MSKHVNTILTDVISQIAKPFDIDEREIKKRSVFVTEEEFDQLSSGVKLLSSFAITKHDVIALVTLCDEPFILSIGNYSNFEHPSCEEWEDENAIFLYVVSQLKILPKSDIEESRLKEYIFTEEDIDTKIEWDKVSQFFPKFNLFRIKEVIPSTETEIDYYLRTMIVSLLCQNTNNLNLPFEKVTLQQYVDVLNHSTNIPVDNFIHSLLSNEWKFCYLDLYRCVERLFKISWIHKFREPLDNHPSITHIDAAMDRIGVVSHEDKCMEYMFSLLPTLSEEMKTNIGETKVDEYIYQLRNEIVHFQKSDKRVYSIEDETWNVILRFLLSSIDCLYKKFEQYILSLPDK